MSKIYLECYAGISGDMTVASLLDLGADEEKLRRALSTLPLSGYEINISRVKKAGIDACDFDVILDEDNHDHDMEYLYGHEHHRDEHGGHEHRHDEHGDHEHTHGEHSDHEHHHGEHGGHEHTNGEHVHDHAAHTHSHEEHTHDHHAHVHRTMKDIRGIIDGAALPDGARKLTEKIFTILAEAEAKAHGISPEEVHFHEVGAVDSIVDITAAAVCFDDLLSQHPDIDGVIVPALYEGTGMVRTQHGILPVPVPAVLNIVNAHRIPLEITGAPGEYVTPTGAAFAAAVRTEDRLPERFIVERTGTGAGKRQQERTGILRAMLIRTTK